MYKTVAGKHQSRVCTCSYRGVLEGVEDGLGEIDVVATSVHRRGDDVSVDERRRLVDHQLVRHLGVLCRNNVAKYRLSE